LTIRIGTKNSEEGRMIAQRAKTRILHRQIKERLKKQEASNIKQKKLPKGKKTLTQKKVQLSKS
jgi:hypothetical protein